MSKQRGRVGTAGSIVSQNPGRQQPEARGRTKDQVVGRDVKGSKRWESYTPEYREWLLRQDAKRRNKRV